MCRMKPEFHPWGKTLGRMRTSNKLYPYICPSVAQSCNAVIQCQAQRPSSPMPASRSSGDACWHGRAPNPDRNRPVIEYFRRVCEEAL
jgi:hypothetical protein